MTYVRGHAASAKYMVSHFTEQLEQMNHQAVPLVFKSILAHRHSVSCLICVVHLNRHVKKYVMWKVCLLKCASLIMVFPSISVPPPPHPLHPPPLPFHEDPTSLGRDVLPLKLHGEFCFSPPWLPQQHATVHSTTAHRLFYLSFVSWYIFNTCRRVCAVIPQGRKKKNSQRGVFHIFSWYFVLFLWLCLFLFCKSFSLFVRVWWAFVVGQFNTYSTRYKCILYHELWLCIQMNCWSLYVKGYTFCLHGLGLDRWKSRGNIAGL